MSLSVLFCDYRYADVFADQAEVLIEPTR